MTRLRFGKRAHLTTAMLAMVSIPLALSLPRRLMWVPGVLYALMGPLHAWNGMRTQAALKNLQSV